MVKKGKTIYLCENCGNEFSAWSGRCEVCGEWNTLKEVNFERPISSSSSGKGTSEVKFESFKSVAGSDSARISTGISEFDRVLGGGIVAGSVILIGGEPGIGKSTIALELAKRIDSICYISAEESTHQLKMRADRLKINSDNIKIASSGDLEALMFEIAKEKPKLLIVDSIQTVFLGSLPATPGSIVQVRECGIYLQRLAKRENFPIIIIGHVTKEGNIAGPRILEHLVDVVLYLEGEKFHNARVLRGIKNRFGGTDEVGLFLMEESGMKEIKNPSELFLAERSNKPGSVVAVTLEGTRPILVEVQALTVATNFGYPKRASSGFDLNRLNLLSAVLSRHTVINCQNFDIYVNIVGGLKIKEPAIDLAVVLAIISSYKNKAVLKNYAVFGEVGLSGEVRAVTQADRRAKEAKNLGYETLKKVADINELIKIYFN